MNVRVCVTGQSVLCALSFLIVVFASVAIPQAVAMESWSQQEVFDWVVQEFNEETATAFEGLL